MRGYVVYIVAWDTKSCVDWSPWPHIPSVFRPLGAGKACDDSKELEYTDGKYQNSYEPRVLCPLD
jgi:hypothetical protein